jgi:parvulin-like peptidyl-prolyl isomerase
MLKTYGLTFNDMETHVTAQMLRDRVMAEITKDMKPEQEQVWVRHSIVATEEEAKKALEEINAGADFAEVTKIYSTDGTKDNGGDLGWMGLEDQNWDQDFLKAAFTLTQVGEISAPIQTQFGYHLIKLIGRAVNPVDETKFQEMKYVKFQNWIQSIKDQRSDITILDDWAAAVPAIPAVPTQLQTVIEQGLTTAQ